MTPYAYVTFSWLLSNLLHPGVFLTVLFMFDNDLGGFTPQLEIEALVILGAAGFICSLLPLLLSIMLIRPVIKCKASVGMTFFLWVLGSVLTIPSGMFIVHGILYGFHLMLMEEQVLLCIPAMVSVLISNLLLYYVFKSMCMRYLQRDGSFVHLNNTLQHEEA